MISFDTKPKPITKEVFDNYKIDVLAIEDQNKNLNNQDAFNYSNKIFQNICEFINEDYIEIQNRTALQAAAEGDLTVSAGLVMKGAANVSLTVNSLKTV